MTDPVFHIGGHSPCRTVDPEEPVRVFTEDCFSGRLNSVDGRPREVAPFPQVNPMVGPIAVRGVNPGDAVAVHLQRLTPARDWGVATLSPDFGFLSGTRLSPNLQPPQAERVWIWRFTEGGAALTTPTQSGPALRVPYRPFHGTLGLAPAHGEVRLGVGAGEYGGNLDIPEVTAGATLILRAGVAGGHVYIGDGHYSQGDGEIAGTAIEGAFHTDLVCDRLEAPAGLDWPRLVTRDEIGVIGTGRPLDDALRIAASGLIRWVAALCALDLPDAQQLVSQLARVRVGNVVNSSYSALCALPRSALAGAADASITAHQRLERVAVADAPG